MDSNACEAASDVLRETGVTCANCGRCKEPSVSTDGLNSSHTCIQSLSVEVANEDYLSWIYYSPVCKEWQKKRCLMLGITLHRGNQDHDLKPSKIGISQAPKKTGRIKGDGTAFSVQLHKF